MKNLLNLNDHLKSEKRLYRLAVATVIGLIFFNQILIQFILNQQRYDAKTISMASRQRLLCNQIVDMMSDPSSKTTTSNDLGHLAEEWNLVHHALQNGNDELGIDRLDGKEVKQIFQTINPYQFKIYDQATGQSELGDIDDLENSAHQYISAMEDIVHMCEDYSQFKITTTIIIEVILALITLLILLFEIKYIFKPAFSKLHKQRLLLKRENRNLIKTQNLLQAIQDSSSLSIIVVDTDFRVISHNKKAYQNFRFVGNSKLKKGMSILPLIPAHIRTNFVANLKDVLTGKNTSEEYCILDSAGYTHWYEIEFHPMKENSHINGIAFSVKEITINKEYEINLEQQNERLKNIAFVQAHELRGPITSMLGLIDIMVEDKPSNGDHGHKSKIDMNYVSNFRHLSSKVDHIIKNIVLESGTSSQPFES